MNQPVYTRPVLPLALFFAISALCLNGCETLGKSSGEASLEPGNSSATQGVISHQIPAGKGSLWAPVSWTLSLTQKSSEVLGDPASEFRLRDISLVLVSVANKSELSIPLVSLQGNSSAAALSLDDLSRTLVSKKIVDLEPGEYLLDHFRGIYIDPVSERPQELVLPIPNPFDAKETEALRFEVEAGKVSLLGRMAFESSFGIKQGKLTSQMRGESLEGDRILSSSFLSDLGWKDAGLKLERVIKGSAAVQDIRHALVLSEASSAGVSGESFSNQSRKNSSAPAALIGFGIESDCGQSFATKLVWQRQGEPFDYASYSFHGGSAGASCESGRNVKFLRMELPPGNWSLASTEIVSEELTPARINSSISRIAALQDPKSGLAAYFRLSSENSQNMIQDFVLSRTRGEQALKRKFSFPLGMAATADAGSEPRLFFLGTFAIDPVGKGVSGTENKAVVEKGWNVLLKKQFQVAKLEQSFSAKSFWNPYVGTQITAKEKLGKIESILKISADSKKASELNPYVSAVRKELTEAFARCVQKHEEADPLVVAQGTLKFKAKKGQKAAMVESFNLLPKESTLPMSTCFKNEFDSFKFKSAVPVSFDAEMRLDAK